MKLKEGFLLREVAGETVVIPSGEGLDLNLMITLNDSGRFLWEKLGEEISEAELCEALCGEYEVDPATAAAHVAAFTAKLRDNGFLC